MNNLWFIIPTSIFLACLGLYILTIVEVYFLDKYDFYVRETDIEQKIEQNFDFEI